MSLLRDVQEALLTQGQEIGPILLRLRFLASRLGSQKLEDWVKHESDGYPVDVKLPDYRVIGISYSATFSGPFGASITNAPIPPYLIHKFAGDDWNVFNMRQSVTSIDALIAAERSSGSGLSLNCSNLILLLQGNVYKGYACNSVVGNISVAALTEIQNVVRNRVLELTLEIERSLPDAAEINFGPPKNPIELKDSQMISKITNQIVYGNLTTISNSGDRNEFQTTITNGQSDTLLKFLSDSGIDAADAKEFINILESETAPKKDDPFGSRAKQWIEKNISKALDGSWSVGLAVATGLLTQAALRYYGLDK